MPFARVMETRTATIMANRDRKMRFAAVRPREYESADQMLRRWLERYDSRRSRNSHRLERDFPFRTPGKKDKPLRYADLWRVDRDEKARSVVALSRVPRLAGFAGSPPAAGFL